MERFWRRRRRSTGASPWLTLRVILLAALVRYCHNGGARSLGTAAQTPTTLCRDRGRAKRRPDPRRVAARRRPPRRADRVVVLHRPPLHRCRRPLRLRVRRLQGQREHDINGYASHFAITDNARRRFAYDQRLDAAPATPAAPGARAGFDLEVAGWTMAGANGDDRLRPRWTATRSTWRVRADKPAVLHDGDGYIDYGTGQASYYYSRTRMAVEGTLTVDGEPTTGHRRGLVRPPVGRLHDLRGRRLGLVRPPARRRHAT